MYHEGMRAWQDRFDSRRIADRLEQVTVRSEFDERDRKWIDRSAFFFLATCDADGWPDCSYKGGNPGFVRVIDDRTLAFPSYDGNGMFRSLGNIRVSGKVGLLFIDLERPKRLRINGTATIDENDPLLAEMYGAQLVVRVTVERIFPNCPRYIHTLEMRERSSYTPEADHTPPIPEWKQRADLRDALPARDPARVPGDPDDAD